MKQNQTTGYLENRDSSKGFLMNERQCKACMFQCHFKLKPKSNDTGWEWIIDEMQMLSERRDLNV